jgi:hypothetical protein
MDEHDRLAERFEHTAQAPPVAKRINLMLFARASLLAYLARARKYSSTTFRLKLPAGSDHSPQSTIRTRNYSL